VAYELIGIHLTHHPSLVIIPDPDLLDHIFSPQALILLILQNNKKLILLFSSFEEGPELWNFAIPTTGQKSRVITYLLVNLKK
jgi:hypothetical protein